MQASVTKNDTKLPRAILRQSARLAQLEEERKTAAQASTSAAAAPSGGNPNADEPTPVVATPPTTPKTLAHEDDPVYWKQRFHATFGTLDAVKKERIAERAEWQTRFNEQQAQIRELQEQLNASKPNEIDLSTLFSAEEIEKYGEEQCRVMAAAAQRVAQKSVKEAMDAELQPIRERQAEQAKVAGRERQLDFDAALTELIPDWKAIDAEDNTPWHEWLLTVNPDTGETHNDTLTRFVHRHDAKGTASVFTKFLSLSKVAPAPVPQPPVAPPSAGLGDAPPPPPPVSAGTGYPSPTEVKDYYKRAALNKVKPEERVKFEARLKLPH